MLLARLTMGNDGALTNFEQRQPSPKNHTALSCGHGPQLVEVLPNMLLARRNVHCS